MSNSIERAADDRILIIFLARIATALVQAAAIYLLISATDAPQTWPATEPRAFNPLTLIAVFVPLIVILGLGQFRARPLAIWTAVSIILIFGLGYHSAWRGEVPAFAGQRPNGPGGLLWLSLAASVFVAHALVTDAVSERRLIPSYSRHFDAAWKQAVQIALAAVFVGVFWAVLYLGAGLFKLIEIDFFRRLIERRWFWCPAVTLAFAVAFHVTDVQPSLIRGARALVLTLFSWLLPLLVVIIAGFLGSLPFVSPSLLWKTGFATKLLLTAAGLLVLLINACYQDGSAEQTNSRIKRLAGSLGAIELLPVMGLAIWALSLRVGQYGWTVDRILAAALILIFCCYALGYAVAVVASPMWLKRIEVTNVATAYVLLAVFVALFSPLADPARLMVASQVARLQSKVVAPDKFDFKTVKRDGARWGISALEVLKQTTDTPDAKIVSARAEEALSSGTGTPSRMKTVEEKAALVAVYPAGRTLPAAFFERNDDAVSLNSCFTNAQGKCAARYVALHPGVPEAIIMTLAFGAPKIYTADNSGEWHWTGTMSGLTFCAGVQDSLRNGDLELEPHPEPDIIAGGDRFAIVPPVKRCAPAMK